ncbi:UDP-N-acetylmuramoyl-L-alanyl-D-glutamate--2,6-diaminopimelate ligase [Halobacillus karajensis]|uniref:UDP-N-acetylmuramyl-tripeptide synthetase n=1 Tax=Halobacillus karajensis TaxID=195088 RepID=A0A024P2N4_9BACI|nr:UDP-N-acetylmuramoyl-L-alanyl-D-glutamate--2,6-diaminopimelate ligase [Halobacillus karajensis]CDQ19409.1 UDP-N-acetylmuramoyl-L-alanyl-D-glutamate--L-lysine ligase [Halobacillus karajensis]CDQ21872.1 UDP-N-acetylmuramoyl-L-alanyl-D-glutamate--L-lysine ligase [Halobacillus karajensis]CDQ27712.1 UDP-N-acetylmuramoyl-L-alanyl-D-glutamate--L-lysine ligase [Halobacillus karajensis]
MKVQEILQLLNQQDAEIEIDKSQTISGVTDDSREVEDGYVFVAVRGYQVDGHHFIDEAIDNGASVVISEETVTHKNVVCLRTINSRRALGKIASAFYGYPSKDKIVIGVTGTNGKTTTSHMIKHICEQNGYSCSMFGTIDYVVNDNVVPGIQTTPSAPMLQQLLYESDDDVVVMEVSSHGLDQYRLEGVMFDFCVFTNLYKDHLDYHSSMEDYFAAKSKLFYMLKPQGKAVINVDDLWGEKLSIKLSKENIPHWKVGHQMENEMIIKDIDTDHFSGTVKVQDEEVTIKSPLQGAHNVYNSLEAYAVGRLLGLFSPSITEAFLSLPGINGRFECYELDNGATVVIDYAHTADSIEHVLDTARQQGAESLIHVFGFRGNRDQTKRGEMIGASAIRSDAYILTLDDLNSESYEDMVYTLEQLQHEYGDTQGRIIPDRTLAIEEAVMNSSQGDWIIITGKGHEPYQQDYHYPVSSDKETVIYLQNKITETKSDLMA